MRQSGLIMRVFGGAAAFCALAFAPIDQASAGCGDYLTVDHGTQIDSDRNGTPLKSGVSPCNGPNCHRDEAPPLTPAAELPATAPTMKAAAGLPTADVRSQVYSEWLVVADEPPLQGFLSSILRPPIAA